MKCEGCPPLGVDVRTERGTGQGSAFFFRGPQTTTGEAHKADRPVGVRDTMHLRPATEAPDGRGAAVHDRKRKGGMGAESRDLRRIFDEALGLPPAQRHEFLDRAPSCSR